MKGCREKREGHGIRLSRRKKGHREKVGHKKSNNMIE
jgi:hypothetical protein